jgi:dynactin-5
MRAFCRGFAFFPLTIGENVMIGESSIVEAASIGRNVQIGKDCIIVGGDILCFCAALTALVPSAKSKRCILKDCCCILDGTILAPDTTVPPFTIFGGSPGETGRQQLRYQRCVM